MKQEQFLNVIDRDEAERRFRAVLDLGPLEAEEIPLGQALGRVLARDVVAPLDVPGFDRANVDGFAVRAEDTFGASEDHPRTLQLCPEVIPPGKIAGQAVATGQAMGIATGAVIPRGADAVIMIEHTDTVAGGLVVHRPVTPGANITFTGTDIGRGETVYRRGDLLTSRETGVLAALGLAAVAAVRRPRVAIVSTGDELVAPGQPLRPGQIYDSNATILADAVRELGGEPVPFGIVGDDRAALDALLRRCLETDVVLLSGGTSKGEGDLSYRAVGALGPPGIVVHGVALKPGKPLCLAAVRVPSPSHDNGQRTVAVVILPGFPTSAIFTFHEFVAPVIRRLAGRPEEPGGVVRARLPLRVNSERGRTEYLLVGLVSASGGREPPETVMADPQGALAPRWPDQAWTVYPMGKGSGSVTAFSRADGFVVIPRQQEYLEAGRMVEVHLLGQGLRPADLVVIGSHCVGLDLLLGRIQERGWRSKFLAVGSTGGLAAVRRGECDLAGIHLLDPQTNRYNTPYVGDDLVLLKGYGRLQGILFRPGDVRFEGRAAPDAIARAAPDPACLMVNRNAGSGTRILIDRLLEGARPPGYLNEARSHNAVAAAVAQSRADWGVAISTVAHDSGLGFIPLREEHYDFVVPRSRMDRPAVRAFVEFLEDSQTRQALVERGFRLS
jgi:putative molybdopterin biosynthesis protein